LIDELAEKEAAAAQRPRAQRAASATDAVQPVAQQRPQKASSGNALKRSPSQRVAFQRALAKRNAALRSNKPQAAKSPAAAAARISERTPSLGSLSELARIAASPRRPAYIPNSANGVSNRTAVFVGAGVAVAVVIAVLTFRMLSSNDSIAETPEAALHSAPNPPRSPFAPPDPTLSGPSQPQSTLNPFPGNTGQRNPLQQNTSQPSAVAAGSPPDPTNVTPANTLPYEPPPTPPDFIPQPDST
jgi:hypothetical protein